MKGARPTSRGIRLASHTGQVERKSTGLTLYVYAYNLMTK